jgi:hypothetical protein
VINFKKCETFSSKLLSINTVEEHCGIFSCESLSSIVGLAKEKKRSLLSAPGLAEENAADVDGTANTSANNAAEELLVISLGIVSECPGMLPELKVNLHSSFLLG